MKMTRMMIQLPWNLKTKLDTFRKQGTTASGYIRTCLEEHFKQPSVMKRKER